MPNKKLAATAAMLVFAHLFTGAAAAVPGPYLLYYEFGSAGLTELSRQRLDEIVTELRRPGRDRTVMVRTGHTDARGRPEENRRLACARVLEAADYLQARGVSPRQMIRLGFGEDQPQVETGADDREPQNRRVEFLFYDTDSVPANLRGAPAERRC